MLEHEIDPTEITDKSLYDRGNFAGNELPGRDSDLKPAIVPRSIRPLFRFEAGHPRPR
jgi:hypothetical protein